jgi:hypothetical protein
MRKERKSLVTLKVDIDPEELKRVVEEGRLSEFINTFPTLAAGHIKGQIVEQMVKGKEVSIKIDFVREGNEFGTWPWPKPFPFIDTVPLPERGLRRIMSEELKRFGK